MCKENDWSTVCLCVVPSWQCGRTHILDTSSKLYIHWTIPSNDTMKSRFWKHIVMKIIGISPNYFFLKVKAYELWKINYQRCMHFGVN